jgi:hypothetical protein
LGFSGGAAQLAALGVVGIALLGEEALLGGGEGKICTAVGAFQRLVHKAHVMASFLGLLG